MAVKNKLHKPQLTTYTTCAAALLAAVSAEGQVIYTDVDPDVQVLLGDLYEFDINDDGDPDFALANLASALIFKALVFATEASNYIAGYSTSDFGTTIPFGSALSAGAEIGPALNWVNGGELYGTFFGNEIGQWGNAGNRFLGIKFNISGNDHYGWVRMDVQASPLKATIKDFAYNATANEPITAITTNVATADHLTAHIYSSDNYLFIQLPQDIQQAAVTILNMLGQTIFETGLTANETSIDLDHLTYGAYLVHINSEGRTCSSLIVVK